MATQETLEALKIVVGDEAVFELVCSKIFDALDINGNKVLDIAEFAAYMGRCCETLGIRDAPGHEQVMHVFRHLDLNNDNSITRDEMEVFLRHLLREQVKTCAEALKKSQQQAMQKAAQALMLDKHKPGMRGLAELALKKPAAS